MKRPVDEEFCVANLVCSMTEVSIIFLLDCPVYCPVEILDGLFQTEVLSVSFAQGLIKFAFDCDCRLVLLTENWYYIYNQINC